MKICSLLPSATEIVCALGLADRLVAITHECDFPDEVLHLPRITSSAIDHSGSDSREIHRHISASVHSGSSIYHLDQRLLEKLSPDLILTQELCDVCAVSYKTVREAVRVVEGDQQILSLEPDSLSGILETIREVGRFSGAEKAAEKLTKQLQERIDAVSSRSAQARTRPTVFAMEWIDPPFAGGHWVPEMIKLAGGEDILGKQGHPSFQVEWTDITDKDPAIIVFMPCGFGLDETTRQLHRSRLPGPRDGLSAVGEGRLFMVDGSSFFNRPGPRIVDGLEILAEILHPELFGRRSEGRSWRQVATQPG